MTYIPTQEGWLYLATILGFVFFRKWLGGQPATVFLMIECVWLYREPYGTEKLILVWFFILIEGDRR